MSFLSRERMVFSINDAQTIGYALMEKKKQINFYLTSYVKPTSGLFKI